MGVPSACSAPEGQKRIQTVVSLPVGARVELRDSHLSSPFTHFLLFAETGYYDSPASNSKVLESQAGATIPALVPFILSMYISSHGGQRAAVSILQVSPEG